MPRPGLVAVKHQIKTKKGFSTRTYWVKAANLAKHQEKKEEVATKKEVSRLVEAKRTQSDHEDTLKFASMALGHLSQKDRTAHVLKSQGLDAGDVDATVTDWVKNSVRTEGAIRLRAGIYASAGGKPSIADPPDAKRYADGIGEGAYRAAKAQGKSEADAQKARKEASDTFQKRLDKMAEDVKKDPLIEKEAKAVAFAPVGGEVKY